MLTFKFFLYYSLVQKRIIKNWNHLLQNEIKFSILRVIFPVLTNLLFTKYFSMSFMEFNTNEEN